MRVAVIGAGIAGLTAAYLLRERHEVDVFERNDYAGGHAHTVTAREDGRTLHLDTGFLVHNTRTYPNLVRLFGRLGVDTHATEMSFSVRCGRCALEYRGTNLRTLFAQKRNLLRPAHWRMLRDLLRFWREAPEVLADPRWERDTVLDYVIERGYSDVFLSHFLLPFSAAIWSAPTGEVGLMPARFAVQFFENHGLLSRDQAPLWRTVVGGSQAYVRAMTDTFRDRLNLDRPVVGIRRLEDEVVLEHGDGRRGRYDAAVVATHADEALKLLGDPSPRERRLLGAFQYSPNDAVLHTDPAALPRRSSVRASWNYELDDCRESAPLVAVTYSLNRLQGLEAREEYALSLNRSMALDPGRVLRRLHYAHPRFTQESIAAQRELPSLNGPRRTFFCGSYFGWGFHEDAHVSGLAVARQLGVDPDAVLA